LDIDDRDEVSAAAAAALPCEKKCSVIEVRLRVSPDAMVDGGGGGNDRPAAMLAVVDDDDPDDDDDGGSGGAPLDPPPPPPAALNEPRDVLVALPRRNACVNMPTMPRVDERLPPPPPPPPPLPPPAPLVPLPLAWDAEDEADVVEACEAMSERLFIELTDFSPDGNDDSDPR
jgi:hypothetical protein